MKIKRITAILFSCTTIFSSQQPSISEQLKKSEEILKIINGPCAILRDYNDTKKTDNSTSTITYTRIDTDSTSEIKRDLITLTFDNDVIAQRAYNKDTITKNNIDSTTSPFLSKINNDTLLISREDKFFDIFKNKEIYSKNNKKNYYEKIKETIRAFKKEQSRITALSCNSGLNSNVVIGSHDGSITKFYINPSLNKFEQIACYQNPQETSPITSIYHLSNEKIIYTQDNRLCVITTDPHDSKSYEIKPITYDDSIITYSSLNNNSIAFCDLKNNIYIIPKIHENLAKYIPYKTNNCIINSIYLYQSHNCLYLYAGITDKNNNAINNLTI